LAAAIESEFGIVAQLKEGHGGIYKVTINGEVVYTNRRQAGRRPMNEEIFQKIRTYKNS
jgi:predicted Rdx family selenoprotein